MLFRSQLRHAADALDCRALLPEAAQQDPQEGYTLRAAITLSNARLLSLRDDVDYYCGGAHPDNWTEGVILDRATGRAVLLTTLFPKLGAARQKTLYLSAVKAKVDAECLNVLREDADEFTAHLSAAGVNLTPSDLPHVVSACAETVTLPYATLRGDANLNSPLVNRQSSILAERIKREGGMDTAARIDHRVILNGLCPVRDLGCRSDGCERAQQEAHQYFGQSRHGANDFHEHRRSIGGQAPQYAAISSLPR